MKFIFPSLSRLSISSVCDTNQFIKHVVFITRHLTLTMRCHGKGKLLYFFTSLHSSKYPWVWIGLTNKIGGKIRPCINYLWDSTSDTGKKYLLTALLSPEPLLVKSQVL